MFNKISQDSKVPNSYIYTSHTGSEYIFLEGTWYNADTLVEIPSSKNHKMNESALRQIAQQNQHSTLQIGNKYVMNENQYVYVGRGRMTLNGLHLTESRNSQVVTIMEAAEDVQVPTGYIYTSGKGKKYFKKGTKWFSSETKQPLNDSAALTVERAAQQKITKHNESSDLKIGQAWTSGKGVTYHYTGENRWISADGKMLPVSTGEKLVQKFDNKKEEEPTEAPAPEAQPEPEAAPKQEPKREEPAPQAAPEPKEEPKAEPKPAEDSNSLPTDVDGLAAAIKNQPEKKRRKIQVLLGRADPLSLLAADIVLAGREEEIKAILKSLNSEGN